MLQWMKLESLPHTRLMSHSLLCEKKPYFPSAGELLCERNHILLQLRAIIV